MPTRMLTVLGVGALVLVVILGVWGWSDHEASAARHATALRAENQDEFCFSLGNAIFGVTGQFLDPNVPFLIPAQPPSDQDLVANAPFIESTFADDLLPNAPPALTDDVERVAQTAAEVSATGTAEPFRSGPVRRSLVALVDYWQTACR